MLTGQNGILTNAQKANYENVYHGADEQVKLAYMAVKTEIMSQKASNSSYNAQDDSANLAKIVKKDLAGSEWKVYLDKKEVPSQLSATDKGSVIKIVYTNPSIVAGGISEGKPAENGQVEYKIILQNQDAVLNADTQYNTEVEESLVVDTSAHTSPYVKFSEESEDAFRVLYDADSPYGIEIISDKNLGDVVELGRNDLAGEGVTGAGSTNTVDRAIWSYTNAIDTLNKAAEARVNTAGIPSNLITQVRCVGSRPENKDFKITEKYYNTVIDSNFVDTSYFNSPTEYNGRFEQGEGVYQNNGTTGNWVIENHNYTLDWNQMGSLNIRATTQQYWLASRRVGAYPGYTDFNVRFVTEEGGSDRNSLFYVNSSGNLGASAPSRGIRPVLKLATNVKILSGQGTSDSPYILGTN